MDETSENQQSEVTLDELNETVANGFDGLSSVTSDGFVGVDGKLDDVLSSIQSLQASDGGTVTGTVTLDQEQLGMLQDGISVVTTECFLLVVLISTLCGLCGWIIFTRGWFR